MRTTLFWNNFHQVRHSAFAVKTINVDLVILLKTITETNAQCRPMKTMKIFMKNRTLSLYWNSKNVERYLMVYSFDFLSKVKGIQAVRIEFFLFILKVANIRCFITSFFNFYTKFAESSFLCRFRVESVNVFVCAMCTFHQQTISHMRNCFPEWVHRQIVWIVWILCG